MPVARHLLVASLSLFATAAGAAQTHYAWVGTYNPNGEGLYRFTVDAKTGALRDKTLVSSLPNVAQLTVSRDGKTLYAASEVEKGVVQAWRIEKNGELTALSQVASGGAGPVYLSLTPDGKHLLVANYVSGSIAVLPVQEDGSLAEAVDRHQDEGPAAVSYTHLDVYKRQPLALASSLTPGPLPLQQAPSPRMLTTALSPTGARRR